MEDRPRVATFLSSIADYSNTIPSAADPDSKSTTAKVGSSRMGTLVGVYLPCVQNIFGVILFIRLSWVVGTAGAVYGFGIVFTCCCVVSSVFFFSHFSRVCVLPHLSAQYYQIIDKSEMAIGSAFTRDYFA